MPTQPARKDPRAELAELLMQLEAQGGVGPRNSACRRWRRDAAIRSPASRWRLLERRPRLFDGPDDRPRSPRRPPHPRRRPAKAGRGHTRSYFRSGTPDDAWKS